MKKIFWVIILNLILLLSLGIAISEILHPKNTVILGTIAGLLVLISLNVDIFLLARFAKQKWKRFEEKFDDLKDKFLKNSIQKYSYGKVNILTLPRNFFSLILSLMGLLLIFISIILFINLVFIPSARPFPLFSWATAYVLLLIILISQLGLHLINYVQYFGIKQMDLLRYFLSYKKPQTKKKYIDFVKEEIIPLLENISENEIEGEQNYKSLEYLIIYLKNFILKMDLDFATLKSVMEPIKKKFVERDYNFHILIKKIYDLNKKRPSYATQISFLKTLYKDIDKTIKKDDVFELLEILTQAPKWSFRAKKNAIAILGYINKNRFLQIILLGILYIILKVVFHIDVFEPLSKILPKN